MKKKYARRSKPVNGNQGYFTQKPFIIFRKGEL